VTTPDRISITAWLSRSLFMLAVLERVEFGGSREQRWEQRASWVMRYVGVAGARRIWRSRREVLVAGALT
jgi:hypothetical protein